MKETKGHAQESKKQQANDHQREKPVPAEAGSNLPGIENNKRILFRAENLLCDRPKHPGSGLSGDQLHALMWGSLQAGTRPVLPGLFRPEVDYF